MKKNFLGLSVSLMMIFLVLSGCKKDSSTIVPPPPADPGPDSAVVSTKGGTYELDNGIILTVPAGAVSKRTVITITPLDGSDFSAFLIASDLLDDKMLSGFSAEPEGLVLSQPMTVSLPLRAVASPDAVLIHAKLNEAGDDIEFMDTEVTFDSVTERIEIKVSEFSRHGALSVANQTWVATFDPTVEWDQCIGWNGVDGDGNPIGSKTADDDCRCGRRTYRTIDRYYVNNGGCQIVKSILKVTFEDCSTPTFWIHILEERSAGCPLKLYCWESGGYGTCTDPEYSYCDVWCDWKTDPCPRSNGAIQAKICIREETYYCGQSYPDVPTFTKWQYIYGPDDDNDGKADGTCGGDTQVVFP